MLHANEKHTRRQQQNTTRSATDGYILTMTLPFAYVPNCYGYGDADLAAAIAQEPLALQQFQTDPQHGSRMADGDFPFGDWWKAPGSEFAWDRWDEINLAVSNGYPRNRLCCRYRMDHLGGAPSQNKSKLKKMVSYGPQRDVETDIDRYNPDGITFFENWAYPGSVSRGLIKTPQKWIAPTRDIDGNKAADRWDYYWSLRLTHHGMYPCKFYAGQAGSHVILNPERSWFLVYQEIVRICAMNRFEWLVMSGSKFADLHGAEPAVDFEQADAEFYLCGMLQYAQHTLKNTYGINLKVVIIAQDSGKTSEWVERNIPGAASWIYDATTDRAYERVVLERNEADAAS